MTQGLPESMLAMKIKKWEDALPNLIRLAYLPRPGIVRLRLTAKGKDKEYSKTQIEEQIEKLGRLLPNQIFGYDDVKLESVVGEMLKKEKATVSTAESCTGGNISSLITSVSGSS